MKEVALYDAKNTLSALVQEVEETGAEVVITRHGKPAARLAPVQRNDAAERVEAAAALLEIREAMKSRLPDAGPLPWETLKSWMRDEDRE